MFKKNNLQIQIFLIGGFITIALLLFNLANSLYSDYQRDLLLKRYEDENKRIAADNLNKKDEYAYFNSDLFKDKYAKENLNKLNAGEKMIVLSEKPVNVFEENSLIEEKEVKIERIILLPNRRQWKEYFFGADRL